VAKKYWAATWLEEHGYLIKAGFALTGLSFSLFKMQNIRWLSFVSNVASLLVCVILIWELPSYYDHFKTPPEIKLFDFNINILVVVGACFFSFTNQPIFVTIIKQIDKDAAPLRTAVQ